MSAAGDPQTADRVNCALRDPADAFAVGVREQQCKLTSRVAPEHVGGAPRGRPQHVSNGFEARIALFITELRVVSGEAFNVRQQERQWCTGTLNAQPFLGQGLLYL